MTYDIAALVEGALPDRHRPKRAYRELEPELAGVASHAAFETDFAGAHAGMNRMFATSLGSQAVNAVGNEGLTLSIIGEFAVEALLTSLTYDVGVARRDWSEWQRNGTEAFIVNDAPGGGTGPTLLLLDPSMEQDGAIAFTDQLRIDAGAGLRALEGAARDALFAGSEERRMVAEILRSAGPQGLLQLLWISQPEVLLARYPEMEMLSCTSPALEIRCTRPNQGDELSSVGMFCRDEDGVAGVTACLHGTGPAGTKVTLGGSPATVKHSDQIQDLAFIPLPDGYFIPPFAHGTHGVRHDRPPWESEPVKFDGCKSGLKSTFVQTHSPGLLWIDRLSQNKVLTKAEVNRGDSGSALIDGDDRVLGFAFRRTRYGEPLEFAEWIWAANAMAALNLKAL